MAKCKVGTHSGPFHADDVVAASILSLLYDVEIVRTRDASALAMCDIVFDVGGAYVPELGKFDHHQKGTKGPDGTCWHQDGYTMSSAGLVWKKFGVVVCDDFIAQTNADVDEYCLMEEVRKDFVKHIDMVDNGEAKLGADDALTLSGVISDFNPVWDSAEQDFDRLFHEAVKLATRLLTNCLARSAAKLRAKNIVLAAPVVDRVMILDKFAPWQDWAHDHAKADDILYVVHPSPDKTWMIFQFPKEKGSFEGRKPLPESWAGLRGDDIVQATGVADAVFSHVGRFCGGAKTNFGAMLMAQIAVNA